MSRPRVNVDADLTRSMGNVAEPTEHRCIFEGCNRVFGRQTQLAQHVYHFHSDLTGGSTESHINGKSPAGMSSPTRVTASKASTKRESTTKVSTPKPPRSAPLLSNAPRATSSSTPKPLSATPSTIPPRPSTIPSTIPTPGIASERTTPLNATTSPSAVTTASPTRSYYVSDAVPPNARPAQSSKATTTQEVNTLQRSEDSFAAISDMSQRWAPQATPFYPGNVSSESTGNPPPSQHLMSEQPQTNGRGQSSEIDRSTSPFQRVPQPAVWRPSSSSSSIAPFAAASTNGKPETPSSPSSALSSSPPGRAAVVVPAAAAAQDVADASLMPIAFAGLPIDSSLRSFHALHNPFMAMPFPTMAALPLHNHQLSTLMPSSNATGAAEAVSMLQDDFRGRLSSSVTELNNRTWSSESSTPVSFRRDGDDFERSRKRRRAYDLDTHLLSPPPIHTPPLEVTQPVGDQALFDRLDKLVQDNGLIDLLDPKHDGRVRPLSSRVPLTSAIIAARSVDNVSGPESRQVLVRWFPRGLLPDEWVDEASYHGSLRMKKDETLGRVLQVILSQRGELWPRPSATMPRLAPLEVVTIEPSTETQQTQPSVLYGPAVVLGRGLLDVVKTLFEREFISLDRKILIKSILLCGQQGPLFEPICRILNEALATKYYHGCAEALDRLLRSYNIAAGYDLVQQLALDPKTKLLREPALLLPFDHILERLPQYSSLHELVTDLRRTLRSAYSHWSSIEDESALNLCRALRTSFEALVEHIPAHLRAAPSSQQ